jgi:hypothetical protein
MRLHEVDTVITLPDGKEVDLVGLLNIDQDRLSDEFAHHAAWLGYVGLLAAQAEAAYEQAKLELETIEAERSTVARTAFAEQNIKATESMVKSWVLMDSIYQDVASLKLARLETYKRLKAIEVAMRERGSMLVSLGATLRQEMDMTDLKMRFKRE